MNIFLWYYLQVDTHVADGLDVLVRLAGLERIENILTYNLKVFYSWCFSASLSMNGSNKSVKRKNGLLKSAQQKKSSRKQYIKLGYPYRKNQATVVLSHSILSFMFHPYLQQLWCLYDWRKCVDDLGLIVMHLLVTSPLLKLGDVVTTEEGANIYWENNLCGFKGLWFFMINLDSCKSRPKEICFFLIRRISTGARSGKIHAHKIYKYSHLVRNINKTHFVTEHNLQPYWRLHPHGP